MNEGARTQVLGKVASGDRVVVALYSDGSRFREKGAHKQSGTQLTPGSAC